VFTDKKPWESSYEARRKRDPSFVAPHEKGKSNPWFIIIYVAILISIATCTKKIQHSLSEAREATIPLESPAAEGNK
tara:strand:- start:562 stop:792 length:231 start_codon:yes stop_codon:yes gene_type:complete